MTGYLNLLKNESIIKNLLTEKVKENGISKMILEILKDIEEKKVLDKYYNIIFKKYKKYYEIGVFNTEHNKWYDFKGWDKKYYSKLKANDIEECENFIKSLIKLKVFTYEDWSSYIYQKVIKINFNLILKNKDIICEELIFTLCKENHLFQENNYTIEYEEMFFRTFKNKIQFGEIFLNSVRHNYSKEFQKDIIDNINK